MNFLVRNSLKRNILNSRFTDPELAATCVENWDELIEASSETCGYSDGVKHGFTPLLLREDPCKCNLDSEYFLFGDIKSYGTTIQEHLSFNP